MSKQYEKSWTTFCELIGQDVDLYLSSIGEHDGHSGHGMKPGPRSCTGVGCDGCPVRGGNQLADWDPCPLLHVSQTACGTGVSPVASAKD